MRQLIPLATGLVTLYAMYVIGNHKWWGWLVGLGNQILWIALIVVFKTWALAPLTVSLIVIYTRNLVQWRRMAALTNGDTVIDAVAGGRSGAPRDLPREPQEAKTRAVLYDWTSDSAVVASLERGG